RAGGIFKRDWWGLWNPADRLFPAFDYVVASLDGAFTEKEENDPSALTVWGVFKHNEIGRQRLILIDAWRKHLQMHGNPTPRYDDEMPRIGDAPRRKRQLDAQWERRVSGEWGLVEWT